jgi:hypothetical protein
MKNYFYLIRTTDGKHWQIVENTKFEPSTSEYLASLLLAIAYTDYVEWANYGVTYRVVGLKNLKDHQN